jgi:hypothetical protein
MLHRAVFIGLSVCAACVPGTLVGQSSNAWNSPASGNWEDMHWSLGQLPADGQVVLVTNSGWKAIAIGPNTVANFPQTLNPSVITIASPVDSYNVLFLNYAGFDHPLSATQLTISSNAVLTTLASALNVNNATGGPFSIGGTLNQGDFSIVTTARLTIGDVGPGVYNMTNGTLLVTDIQNVGSQYPSFFNQFGGTNYPDKVLLQLGGQYVMYGGNMSTHSIAYSPGSGSASGNFKQLGGVVKPDRMYVNVGDYFLAGGLFSSPDVEMPMPSSAQDYYGGASFTQTGGTNLTGSLSLGNLWPPYFNASPSGDYTLSNGVLVTSDTTLGPWGGFAQSGGTHTTTSLGLYGDQTGPSWASYAEYSLSGGILSAGNISAQAAYFTQSGGTNQVAGDLNMSWRSWYGSTYNLSGGVLLASNNTMVCSVYSGCGFTQSGGLQVVSNLLTVSRADDSATGYVNAYSRGFVLAGGQLTTRDILVDNGATFHHNGGTLSNSGTVTLADGIWEANTNQQQLGRLVLAQGTNSGIYMPAAAAVLRFAASGGIAWSGPALLTIENWNGSLTGGGAHQIYFGTNAAGLSAAQLAQLQFRDPAGSSGVYPATILASGEIVPARLLVSRPAGRNLQISWAPGMRLQTSTNISGPYSDVPGAPNPYLASFNEPRRFFRLSY